MSQGPYQQLNYYDWLTLGKQYYPNLPYGQNATTIVMCLYDWSTPDYRRMQFPLTTPGNVTAFENSINLFPAGYFPYVPEMFNLKASSQSARNAELKKTFDQVSSLSAAEINVIDYGLYSLPEAPYSASKSPKILYRGGGRDVEFYCNQFGSAYGVSIDDCIFRHFYSGNNIQVNSFWSTTPDISVIAHFQGLAQYHILPGRHRTSWLPREIDQFSIEKSSLEWLYPHGSQFRVINRTCDRSTYQPFWKIYLEELGPETDTFSPSPSAVQPKFEKCTGQAGVRYAADATQGSTVLHGKRGAEVAVIVGVILGCVAVVVAAVVLFKKKRVESDGREFVQMA